MVDTEELSVMDEPTVQTNDDDQSMMQPEDDDVVDSEEEILDTAKEAIIEQITSTDYDLELKKALMVAAQEHFDSNEATEQTRPDTGVTTLMDRLWDAFNDYKDYRSKNNNPLETSTEVNFRTEFIYRLVKIMMDAGENKHRNQIATNSSNTYSPSQDQLVA